MPERPIILFPTPEKANRNKKNPAFPRTKSPSFGRQYSRLGPVFQTLQTAFEHKNLVIQQSPVGINTEFALVFEIIGSVENFYAAVKKTEGLEWIFDKEIEDVSPDDDFYKTKNGEKTEESLEGKVYCIMSNQQAMHQLLSLWQRHANGESNVFEHGFAGLRDVFTKIKTIRKWNAEDRIAETHVVDYWRESLELDGDMPVPFEIELFFREDPEKRRVSKETVTREISQLGGNVLQECEVNDIAYHALLVDLPRNEIENLVNRYEEIQLSQVDDVMFFRPTCQSAFISSSDAEVLSIEEISEFHSTGAPIAAVLDGMPIQNHVLLRNHIIIDDPDNYSDGYESKYRVHGTAMSSLVIYGDLSKRESPIFSPIYVRPILRPRVTGFSVVEEKVPTDRLFVDVIHRAIKRIAEGENGEEAVAPTIKIINLSIGDPVRQFATTMSPVARMIDYLAYKYRLLFIISSGNHPEIIERISSTFSSIKTSSVAQRNEIFWNAIKENQRNLKVLSPAESLNCLSIGALYDDFSEADENDRFIFAVEKGLPSPISAFGKGYKGMITPDLYYNGGRKFVKGNVHDQVEWVLSNRAPGCLVAAPYDGAEAGQAYSFGTSDAAAQITHEAIKCYEILSQVFLDETGGNIPDEYISILLKSMLTHGASWENLKDELHRLTGDGTKKLSRWLGNGVPHIERVKECTKERITLIGIGRLKKEEGDVFRLPLHVDFSSKLIKRKLTVSLAYLSPIIPNKQAYRAAQLWFDIDDGGKGLFPEGSRQNSEWQAVRKGTLQHEIFVGERPIAWNNDDLYIKVNCKEDAGKLRKEAIPYCLFVSFEIAEGYDIDLYATVANEIRPPVQIVSG